MSDFDSFPVAERKPSLERLSAPAPAVDGRLVVPLYLIDGFYRRAVWRFVSDVGIDSVSFAKEVVCSCSLVRKTTLSKTRI